MNDTEQRLCKALGCERTLGDHSAKGYCSMHYKRLTRHGDPHIVYPSRPRHGMPNKPGERVCARCEVSKPVADYTPRRGKQEGQPLAYCRPCQNLISKETYVKHREKKLATKREYKRSDAGREVQRRAHLNARAKYPEKEAARVRLRSAVNRGDIQRQPCQECGNPKVDAHHYLGYEGEHWKDVLWLCRFHHFKAHGRLTESYIKQVEGALNAR